MGSELLTITPAAIAKIKGMLPADQPILRVGVQGGGCSGFSYALRTEDEVGPMDTVYEFDGQKVVVDQISAMYLEGCTIDFVETLAESGFKFTNPKVKTTCGCGQSFSV